MLSCEELVHVYLHDLRPLPTPLMMIVLEYSGLVTRGQRSLSFWVYWRRPVTSRARQPAGRSRRRLL